MKTLQLQMVTVGLENGEQGVFVGWPLVSETSDVEDGQVETIWFSSVQEVPDDLTLKQLMELVRKELCACMSTVQ
ncbi:MAG: hypothetical protein OEN52_11945 [Gammaproteobacteria bacterium]|nr:hypothetical protein [Gammaproteobacteria bacterium]MDH3561652.1 hypothetical protein [Gammaproteobacteria bacterium]